MYRQRKRDLNLKPNRQLDKRSSRGMIYENEELRMRTIAICEDVDRGQNDIKKLRKENDHLKREIWGLRDECEKLEEILKKVCISANIPEFQLEASGQKKGRDEDDSDDGEDDEDDTSSYGGGSDQHLKIGDSSGRKRKESDTSVVTFDSDVGSCITTMFGEDPGGGEAVVGGQEVGFAVEDPGSVIMSPESITTTEVICHTHPASSEPVPSTSFAQQPSWSHPTAACTSDLERIREETESAISSPLNPSPIDPLKSTIDDLENIILPDPSLVMLHSSSSEVGMQENMLVPTEGRKTPVIQITPASSPASNETGTGTEPQSPTENVPQPTTTTVSDPDSVHSAGCVTVVPKTFKVTSEIVVGESNGEDIGEKTFCPHESKSEELPRKILKFPPKKQDSDPLPSDQIVVNQSSFVDGFQHPQRRSCYYPSEVAGNSTQTLPPHTSNVHHRNFGMLAGYPACCCCGADEPHFVGGYQSEPSLNHALMSTSATDAEEHVNFFNPFQCCRVTSSVSPVISPPTLRSVWNTVDRNIVIGFYGVSGSGGARDGNSIQPRVQEIIDELETQFDPTLENIQGIRLIPGRIFISLKNAPVVTSFLQHFKNDLVLQRKNTQQKIRIHFIEGASQKLTSTLVLSGIPQELGDLTVISSLNQFGQVVAPLERRNYKGVDISERIAKMHLVVGESSLPEFINVNGYNVKIQVEKQQQDTPMMASAPLPSTSPTKYGFVAPANTTTANVHAVTISNPATSAPPAISALKPHKPVIRSSSSAPKLETPLPGTLTCPLPPVEQKRQSSVCVGNIPPDQHPSKLIEKHQQTPATQHKVTIAQQSSQQSIQGSSTQTLSTPNLQPPPKKPLARLLVSSPGSFQASPPVSSPVSPVPGENAGGGGIKGFYRNFDPRRAPSAQGGGSNVHAPLTPSSSYSPRTRRKSSVQFAGNLGKGGKREPLPWCGCWGLGCGN